MKASSVATRGRALTASTQTCGSARNRPTAEGSGRLLSYEYFRTNLSIPDLLLLRREAEVVDPPGTRNLAIQLFADRSNHSHEQKPGIGEGREFAGLFRPTGGANEILRCHKNFAHIVSITQLKSQPAVRSDSLHPHMAGKSVPRFRLDKHELEHMTIIDVARPVEGDSKRTRTLGCTVKVESDNGASDRQNTPIESAIQNVGLKAAVCN